MSLLAEYVAELRKLKLNYALNDQFDKKNVERLLLCVVYEVGQPKNRY